MWYILRPGDSVIELKVSILASGSSGNAILIEAGGRSVLLDAGLSLRELTRRAAATGHDLAALVGIFISHEHADHIAGAPLASTRHRVPLFLNKATHEEIARRRRDFDASMAEHFETGDTVGFNGLTVRTFTVPHDAADPVGFVVAWEDLKVGVVTDVGTSTHLLEERLRDCDALVLESNHDEAMLDAGPYPPDLKRRIRGRHGHLSNDQCSEILKRLYHPGLSHLVLAHLSETNNTPMLAFASACRGLPAVESPPKIIVASQSKPVRVRLKALARETPLT